MLSDRSFDLLKFPTMWNHTTGTRLKTVDLGDAMPSLTVCTDSVLQTEGPFALMSLLAPALGGGITADQTTDNKTSGTHACSKIGRRSDGRIEFPFRLLLYPVLESTGEEIDAITVTGKNLTKFGLGIIHSDPLPFRRARIESNDARLGEIGLGDLSIALTIRWCRFLGPSNYESGGRVSWPKSLFNDSKSY